MHGASRRQRPLSRDQLCENLRELVDREGPLEPVRARLLALQAARALAEAHGRGMVHRDVKPENLIVTAIAGQSDFLKVVDFGIVKLEELAAGPDAADLTDTGRVLGTPRWISPEVARGGEADARSDVYALGAVLYFLLCGKSPFEGVTSLDMLLHHIHQRPTPPSQVSRRVVPRELEEVVMRCLAKDPADRFESCAELSAALAECRVPDAAHEAVSRSDDDGPNRTDVDATQEL